MIAYNPCVCHQTSVVHTHYDFVMVHPEKFLSNLEALRYIANRVGGQIASQVVLRVQELLASGDDLRKYGVNYLRAETVPLSEICQKGENYSLLIDWDKWVIGSPPLVIPSSHAATRVAHISRG